MATVHAFWLQRRGASLWPLQLGGSNPAELATCRALARAAGFAEVNRNVGCPSDRYRNNMIGCLPDGPSGAGGRGRQGNVEGCGRCRNGQAPDRH